MCHEGLFSIFWFGIVNENIFLFHFLQSVISPKPIDQEPEQHFVGVIIAVLTTIILLLIAVILFIVARNKRSRRSEALNSLQFNFNQDTLGLGIDKRMNSNMKVIVCVFVSHSFSENKTWDASSLKLFIGLIVFDPRTPLSGDLAQTTNIVTPLTLLLCTRW